MPVTWTIAGQTGSTFNATARTLEVAKINSARLEFKSLEPDTLTFTITPDSITSAVIPDLRQEMILYRDGVRFFSGNVTNVRNVIESGSQQCQVTVSGPWWWLERIPFTSNQTDGTGASAERISYVFADGQGLSVNIEAAINRSAELGAPIATIAQGSAVSPMFGVPRITMNQSTCGQVISELVRICPDTMVWFDYSTKPIRIFVDRRGSCPTVTFDVNTSPITSIDINPIIDLEVSQVVLPYVQRDDVGRAKFNSQSAGTNVTAKRQVITISGPELDTFLPNDYFDSQIVRELSIKDYIGDTVSGFKSFISKYGFNPIAPSWPAAKTASSIYFWSNGGGFTITNYSIDAANVPNGYFYAFGPDNTADPEDWVINDLGLQTGLVTGGIHGQFEYNRAAFETYKSQRSQDFFSLFGGNWWSDATYSYCGGPIKEPIRVVYSSTSKASLFKNMSLVVQSRKVSGSVATVTLNSTAPSANINGLIVSWVRSGFNMVSTIFDWNQSTRTFKINVSSSTYAPAVGQSLSTNSKLVYRSGDYSFINPPAGLADNLLSAQNWTPYEGSITLEEQDAGATRYRGKKININNSVSSHSTMGALVNGESIDIESGRTTISLGAPARNDYRTLVDKIRKTSQDNIVYI
jgi:hypothetical protein